MKICCLHILTIAVFVFHLHFTIFFPRNVPAFSELGLYLMSLFSFIVLFQQRSVMSQSFASSRDTATLPNSLALYFHSPSLLHVTAAARWQYHSSICRCVTSEFHYMTCFTCENSHSYSIENRKQDSDHNGFLPHRHMKHTRLIDLQFFFYYNPFL